MCAGVHWIGLPMDDREQRKRLAGAGTTQFSHSVHKRAEPRKPKIELLELRVSKNSTAPLALSTLVCYVCAQHIAARIHLMASLYFCCLV